MSGEQLGEREGAMAPRGNQVVLPVSREQDRINACAVRTRGDTQDRPIGIVAVHSWDWPGEVSTHMQRLEETDAGSLVFSR
jgi:hypothetical protein